MKTTSKDRKASPASTPSDFAGGSTDKRDRRQPGQGDFEREGRFADAAAAQGTAKGAEPAVKPNPARSSGPGRPVPSKPTVQGKGKASKRV